MPATPTFQDYLETYLKNEGVFVLIPKSRRFASFPIILTLIWFIGTLAISSIIGYTVNRIDGVIFIISVAVGSYIATFLGVIIYHIWKSIIKKQNVRSSNTSFIDVVFNFIVYPAILSIAMTVYAKSWLVGLVSLLSYLLTILLVVIINAKAYGIYVTFRSVLITFVDLIRSIWFAFVLFPLLLIVIFLSVFSGELWQSIGNVTITRLAIAIILLASPTILLAVASFKSFVRDLMTLPQEEQVFNTIIGAPYIKDKVVRGFISDKELLDAKYQFSWRDKTRLLEEVNVIEKIAARSLLFLLFSTSVILMLIFLIYFYFLFKLLIGDEIIASWTQIPLQKETITLGILDNSFGIGYSSSDISLLKTSVLLSVFVAITTLVQSFTDETVKNVFFNHLQQKVNTWLSMGAVYHSLVNRNFQLWSIDEAKNKPGIVNVSVVIPRGLEENQIKAICEYVEEMFQRYDHFVSIIAFEQNTEKPIYRRGFPARKWVLTHNKKANYRNFTENHISVDDEPEYDHLLGDRLLLSGDPIPDEWFGNTSLAVQAAKIIWDTDINHDFVLHPSGFNANKEVLLINIQLRKRMLTSEQYVAYVKALIEAIALLVDENIKSIMIVLYLGESVDRLASGDWIGGLSFMSYSDEFIDKTRYIPIDTPPNEAA